MPPISVMTTDSTVAKIGRSMKKRAIMLDPCEWVGAGNHGPAYRRWVLR